MAADGLITIKSNYGPEETMARLEAAVTAKGMTVFAHIDHAAAAAKVGMKLRATDLLIFGSPKGGTPAMQSVQTIGIDLPLKALVTENSPGRVEVSLNDANYIIERHALPAALAANIAPSAKLVAATLKA